MTLALYARSIRLVAEKNMRIYYYKGPVIVFGLLFPLLMFLTFFIGRDLDIVRFYPGFLGMMLFFTASSVGPLITPWEKREKTYERLLSLPVTLESLILGDLLAGAIFGWLITLIVWIVSAVMLHLPLASAGTLAVGLFLGGLAFAALGSLLASPATDTPSNIMMLSSLVRLPLIFVSGVFIPLHSWTDGRGYSPLFPRSPTWWISSTEP
jgi:ABC-2 type transporter.